MTRAGMSPQARRHNALRRQAILDHPELKQLNGADWRSALLLPVILTAQWGMAWAVSDAPIWVIFLAAFFWGQFAIHSAGALLHETSHKLVFRGARAKLAFDLGLEVILSSYGRQLIYQHEHITSHHPHMGDYEHDYEHEDICAIQSRMQLRADNPRLQRVLTLLTLFVHALPLGVFIGDVIFPKVNQWLTGRPQKDPARNIGASQPSTGEMRLFMVTSALSNLTLLLLFGPWALLYQIWPLSLFLGKMGVWNLGQSLSEHEGTDEDTPTRSTYGWINIPFLNTGYHNEHHTFPNVPWTKLPVLTRTVPHMFNVTGDKSYAGYWLDHVRGDFTATRRNPQQSQDNQRRCAGQGPA
jgi:sphingolipid delta-4 desaturase